MLKIWRILTVKSDLNTTAFVYKWIELSTGKWYIGARIAKGCNPSDGYICSSKEVLNLIRENKEEWHREILAIGNPLYIRELENLYLNSLQIINH